ncbi:MAG: hypothetical protein ACLFTK_08470 [Anaerolineales bacterium]
MAAKDDLKPLVDDIIEGMTSNEFTTYDYMMAFGRFQEKAFVKALHENIDHAAGPFGAVREIMEALLGASEKASKLKDDARAIDLFGLPGTTKLWQKKKKA